MLVYTTMKNFQPSPHTTLKRLPERGSFDRDTVNAILDEAFICHVGFAVDGQPFVIPTSYARVGDQLFIHGSAASRMLRSLSKGIPVCVTVTLPLTEVSAKVRTGPPKDDEADHALPVWSGELPLHMLAGMPLADAHTPAHQHLPEYILLYDRRKK